MRGDRVIRSLTSLGAASSSRVLNLCAIALAQAGNENHKSNPLFESRALNSAIVLKHRLRANETELFAADRAVATKIIIPFQKTDLKLGGQAFFVEQRGFEELLRQVGNYKDDGAFERDRNSLILMDRIPSLDPFMLREQLRANGIEPDASYFAISPVDQQRIHAYAVKEIRRLTMMAQGSATGTHAHSTSKMVSALLSNDVSEKLEPLRLTLDMQPVDFNEGVFSWRGFLYYKWTLDEFWPELVQTLREIRAIQPSGHASSEQKIFFANSKRAVIRNAKFAADEVVRIMRIYDAAYNGLIDEQKPRLFRDFLLEAPMFFLSIGDRLGAMQHVTSFWKYRFPKGVRHTIGPDELTMIFQDFLSSFGDPDEASVQLVRAA